MTRALLAIDQGTTRTKAVVFDAEARPLAEATTEIPLVYPHPGWVEQDPEALFRSVVENGRAAVSRSGVRIEAMGLANQGETVIAWDRGTGKALYNAIGWQDRRTDAECERLRADGAEAMIRERTGLPLDPYFSATKIVWMLDRVEGARARAERGDLLAGTTDSWFLWRLTGRHQTDHSTASRTMLYNPHIGDWDDDVLNLFRIPRHILPEIRETAADFGTIGREVLGQPVPIAASVVDQQGALFGQVCYQPGDIKVTYGTGAFILQNAGRRVPTSNHGLLPTVAWSLHGRRTYALDGGIYVAGAAVQWLRDELGVVSDVAEASDMAMSVPGTGDVFVVPALAGLAAPYWDSYARGTIIGITRGTKAAHIVRATLEGIAYRTRDVVDAMVADTGHPIHSIKVDGGASVNAFLMQSLADVLNAEVRVAAVRETTSLGAAFMAGLQTGVWPNLEATAALWQEEQRYIPGAQAEAEVRYRRWREAVERAKGWSRVPAEE